ncbi:MAG: hypothetical protein LBS63_02915, partial [Prevotellaceae bacterium]|nr:hypothetical protein [Prevotellaceae bacterium]
MKKLFAITGNPVLQSQSPVLFSAAYPSRADEFAYVRMAAQSAAEAMQLFAELGMSAMNVTAPFKGAVAQLADECAPEVQALKATNAVVRGEDGKTRCYNTDVAGVLGCLRDSGVALPGKRCLVLGAGGAGSAAAYALSTAGADVLVANRTIEKAQRLADNLGCRWCSLADIAELAPQVDMIVNTLYAQVDVVETAWLSPRHIVFDAIYHASLLREKARQAGCTFVDGEGWLLHQGLPAYRLFTGIEPEEASMRRMRRASFAPSLHVSLVGFMGVGKSTVAPLLAALLERPVADTDAEVERRCGLPVPRLIAEKGEAYFREQERTVVEALLGSPTPSVIACGG